ncbi:complement C3-like [Amblyraja radiata]|uniref:complement C3-like n=1 Tax=Amblyraja radiata TaxID=386614 RepID=UPI00140338B2|nr:complement C3-like [Amblyraja radiata]
MLTIDGSRPQSVFPDRLYILTAPNVLRIQREETVVVEAHNVASDIVVQINLKVFPERHIVLYHTEAHLTSANDYLASATVKIDVDNLPKIPSGNQYVYLEAISTDFTLQTVILVSLQAGYIFIQTDKPLYTPTQTVLYRLLAVDNEMKPCKQNMVVDYVNPQDVIVERFEVNVKDASGIVAKSFPVPEIVNIGMWKIVASYKDAPAINFTTQFEVKEYVLPSFDVTLESKKPFFHVDDTELHITVTARFTYGKPVQGRAFILFGIMKDGEKLSIAKSLQSVPVIDGSGEASLKREQLIENFKNIDELVGRSIYVTASVITHAGIDMVVAEKTGIKIVVRKYIISFSKTSKYYKPGLPLNMMVYVTTPDGSPASGVPVKVDSMNAWAMTRVDGIAIFAVNTAVDSRELLLKVSTDSPNVPPDQQASAMMVAKPYMTLRGSRNYLNIDFQYRELRLWDNVLVRLHFVNDNKGVQDQIRYVTYMFINKGKIVKVGRQLRMKNQNVVAMQFPINSNLFPSFRLLVYYYVVIGRHVELVADSVWIDVEDTCIGTLKLSAANPNNLRRTFYPGQALTLKLTGDPGAKVVIVAVDKAVFALSKKNKITQSKIWSVVEKNDIGCTPGSGSDVFGVFSDAGLAFVTSTDLKTERRTGADNDDEYYDYEDLTSRTQFPESWLWMTNTLPSTQDENGHTTMELHVSLKDRITTWEIQAVSLSPTKGLCVAEPYEVIVMKDFFIDLQLPYSTVLNEQVEIRAVVNNNFENGMKVRVQFPYNENLCSHAKLTERYTTTVNIPGKSTAVVPYVIIPLTIGEIMIEVKASVHGLFVGDAVRKPLRVLPEGLVNQFFYEMRDHFAETMESIIDEWKLTHLIQFPSGDGEENMEVMSAAVIGVIYTDKYNQWEKLEMDTREIALKYIYYGYTHELQFRKDDGSFATLTNRKSSTWLTAYVVKVFTMAHNLVLIDRDIICGAVKWLILKEQKLDGQFTEESPVLHTSIIGGMQASNDNVALTAFVLIALIEAKPVCLSVVQEYNHSIKTATAYLLRHIDGLERSYDAVISAYALSLMGISRQQVVMRFASPDQSHWPVRGDPNSLYTIEATGYALLFLLQQMQYDQAGKLVRWLSKRNEYGGGLSSTQATIIALQAQAKYVTVPPEFTWNDLTVKLYIQKNLRAVWINIAPGFVQSKMISTSYYGKVLDDKKDCKRYNLQVTVEHVEEARRPEGVLNTLLMNICTRYHGDTPSSFVILDVSMLTGFTPDSNDLEQLKDGIEKFIARYEIDGLSTGGSLIIYLNTVPNLEESCFAFKVHQFYNIGFIQPAAVKLYEYYNTTNTCTKFYNVPEPSDLLWKICQEDDECRCAEGSCVSIKTDQRELIKRDDFSCAPGTDYVYKVTFIGKEKRDSYIYYAMKILALIKQGSDAVAQDDERELITHANCNDKFNVELNQDYLIMGRRSDLWFGAESVRYLIGENTWIERWPSNAECQEEMFRELCTNLRVFADDLGIFGCDS